MAASRAYLDHNASARLLPAAHAAMLAALEVDANPSSVHADGRSARRIVDGARRDVAALAGGKPEHVVFTSGATEAASMLLSPDWRMGKAPVRMARLIVSAADHPCILNGGRFAPDAVTRVGVDADGIVDMASLERELASHDRAQGLVLVAIHAANNETGVIQPVRDIAALVKAHGGVLVVDAVQAAGRIPLDISDVYGDFLILSSHKIGGPKGVGAVVGVSDLMMPVPLVSGGGQEKGFRAGTENVPGIAGFGAAAREALTGLAGIDGIRAMRDAFERVVVELAPDATIFGNRTERLCNTLFFAVPGLKAETAQIAFDLAGVSLSAGSACSSGKVGPSHVLKAMGHGEAAGALRVSIGPETGEAELKAFEQALRAHLARRDGRERAA
ncbi:cysteine desulfurase family protein [Neoaquamicrobium sediminum]|uniref:cysteine desulfurase family protein n=1 Tax=Neoaquamicrobium sediminum TaxID=1849104 RepID=UPI003BAAD609